MPTRYALGCLILAALAVSPAAAAEDSTDRKIELKNGDRILFFGDSLTYLAGMEELIGKLQKEKIQVVQCTLTSVGEKHDGTNKDDRKLDEFAEVERQVARAMKVPLNDLRKAFVEHWKKNNPDNKPNGILTYDGNHFNDAGHRFVAEQMLKKFK